MTSSIQMKSLDIYREANDGRTTSSNASFDSCSFFVSSSHGDDDALHLNRNDNTNLATENGGTGHFTAACFRTVSLWLAGLKHIQGCQVVCRRSGGTPCVPCNPCTSLTTCTGRIPPVNAKVSFEVRVKPLYKNPCYLLHMCCYHIRDTDVYVLRDTGMSHVCLVENRPFSLYR